MLDNLDKVPWAKLEHAYGTAEDVPDELRKLLDADPKVREQALWTLYGNVFHQGTRYEATAHVVPFLIEMCSSPDVPARWDLLRYWGDLIVGYFNIQERGHWGDGTHEYYCGQVATSPPDEYVTTLHAIYRASLEGEGLLYKLLEDESPPVRYGAAWVLACLPTIRDRSVPRLIERLRTENEGAVRVTLAFALGELGEPASLWSMLKDPKEHRAAQCMAACELARICPSDDLAAPLRAFIAKPIEGYNNLPGTGGTSSGDAAYSIAFLSSEVRVKAIPEIAERLRPVRSFATMPLVGSLLEAAFQPRQELLTELTPLQRGVLLELLEHEDVWTIANLSSTFSAFGLKWDRTHCARLAGVKVAKDEAVSELSSAVMFAQIGFDEKARDGIDKALKLDPAVFGRVPAPDEYWLFTAKAFAETDPERAIQAYVNARSTNPHVRGQVALSWALADLLRKRGIQTSGKFFIYGHATARP
ncbi:hypothetical protein AYO47_00155 [Planctomyces sp. SCGC AG-212-M04]|nr:hypothetical protein AYO47_00155 [Planctomyces sp. SCGC AG-212-M04]